MSNPRISLLASIAIRLVGLFGLLRYSQHMPSVRYTSEAFCDDHCVCSAPRQPNMTERPFLEVPGELYGFTPHIWQTTGPQPLTTVQENDIASWRAKHPFFTFTLMTDEQGDRFVRDYYSHRPDIADLYLRLPIPIFKADLWRYLVLVENGGIYADTDALYE